MNTLFRRMVVAGALSLMAAGMAGASIIYSTATSGLTSTSPVTLTLNDFNTQGGTLKLDSVTIYYYAEAVINDFSLTSQEPTATAQFNPTAFSNLTRSFSNTANSADIYTGEIFQTFDTGNGTNLGNCTHYPANPIPPGTCAPVTLGPGATQDFGGFTTSNINPIYGFTTGTGQGGVTGVVLQGTNITSYQGTGTFNISVRPLATTSNSEVGSSTANSILSESGSNLFSVEVDYTYETLGGGTPEPASVFLMGTALMGLIALGFVRRKAQQ